MINGNIFALGTMSSQLMNELLQVVLHLEDTKNPKEYVDPAKTASLLRWLEMWQETARSFELSVVENAIIRLKRKLEDKPRYGDLDYGLQAINDSLYDGLKFQLIYRYPSDRAAVLKSWKSDWGDAIVRFPEAAKDMLAATDLWALGHYTASVFHTMRVLESGLGALTTELSVNHANENWQNVIEQIGSAIKQEQKTLPRGGARNTRLQFLSEAAKEFMYFKDGWRNYVSHNKRIYGEAEARSVLEHSRQFMLSLASHLPRERE